MRILVAGPGTGKTTGIRKLIDEEFGGDRRILVLSFTNATVKDLGESFSEYELVECHTLHSFALQINPVSGLYILSRPREENIICDLAGTLQIGVEELCEQLGCITFDGMISRCASFLESNPIYGQDQIGPLSLLIVDEYQDFNAEERRLVDLIANCASETIILGDDDQSIYGFKDADPDGIIALYNSDAVTHIEHHNRCYRCPDVVVESATNLIRRNRHRINKPWHPTGKDGLVHAQQVRTQAESAQFVIDQIQKIRTEEQLSGQESPATFMILGPMRWYVDDLMRRLEAAGIEYVDFWSAPLSAEEYEAIWWTRVILSRRPLVNLIFLFKTLSPHFRKKFKAEVQLGLSRGDDANEVAKRVLPMFSSEHADVASAAPSLEELRELRPDWIHILDQVDPERLEESLDNLVKSLTPEREFSREVVNIMSIHKSKGLQADVVFITGLVDGIVPNSTRGLDTIEAQRRLLFVGMTRALQALFLLSPIEWTGDVVNSVDKAKFKYDYSSKQYLGRASPFLGELA